MAQAADPDEVSAPHTEVDPEIYQGDVASTCEFPTTLLLNGCTGTLVHPQVITTAAHCPSPTNVKFGESQGKVARTIGVSYCVGNPLWSGQVDDEDAKFCVLNSPVNDVPLTPPMYGCEVWDLTTDNDRAWVVGFGKNSDAGGFGTKRYKPNAPLNSVVYPTSQAITIGSSISGVDSCSGDSGGPAYMHGLDGVFRAFGIVSGGPTGCGSGFGTYGLIHAHVQWIESASGYDITPCFDDDGSWNPTAACGNFSYRPVPGAGDTPVAPGTGSTWSSGCDHQRSGLSSTCGAPYGQATPPPTIDILYPADQEQFDGPSAKIDLDYEITHPWPARTVRVFIDGQQIGEDDYWPPFELDQSLNFPEGTWEISVWVEDWAGNEATDTVTITVGDAAGTTGGTTDGGGSTSGTGDSGTGGSGDGGADAGATAGDDAGLTGGTGGETGDDFGAGGSSDDGGCNVVDGDGGTRLGWIFLPLALLGLSRRRSEFI